ncbi:MAG: prepilin-type N-terminal cleavage/methylation domain-containing protein [Planctomycetes bacterium]|nr:prepilin-type N-terminal cleavage/methylation domain-containing protein [Planctomycetota bacterium]
MKAARRNSGFTLMELMVVTVIAAIILGMGTAFFAHMERSYRLRAAGERVAAVVRAAGGHASWSGYPTRTDFDAQGGTVRATGGNPVGQWHLEGNSGEGAFGRDAHFRKSARSAPGAIGEGVELGDGDYLDCGEVSKFPLGGGIAIEAWVQPFARADMVAMNVGDGAALGLREDLAAVGLAGSTGLASPPEAVPLDRWTLLALVHDGRFVTLYVDHVAVARAAAKGAFSATPSTRVTIGDPSRSFIGRLDEVRIHSVVGIEEFELGLKYRFETLPAGGSLVFDAHGRLSEFDHAGDETIEIYSETEEETRTVTVERSGRVRTGP